jgi:hypothetical protein
VVASFGFMFCGIRIAHCSWSVPLALCMCILHLVISGDMSLCLYRDERLDNKQPTPG